MTDDELKVRLLDPVWRIHNLYSVITDEAQQLPLVLYPEQDHLLKRMWYRNLVLKARQIGFTTFIDAMALDQCLFNPNYTAGIIAHSLPDAQKIFRNKVRKVYDALPKLVRELTPIRTASASEIVFENGSSISVGTSNRGGTLQFLHVSEMGKIARRYPEKATEIVTGAFEAVPRHGLLFVESTAEGRAGWFYEAVMEALRRQQQGATDTALDFRLHFFPWFSKDSYRIDPAGVVFSDADMRYFAELQAKAGIRLDRQQMAWYVKKRQVLGDNMLREYPGMAEEAFQASVAGMIYADQMRSLRLLGRLGAAPLRPEYKVNTFWDFGVNDHNSIWLHQRIGAVNRFVRYFQDQNQGLAHYWKLLEGWRIENGAKWGKHYLPHDADTRMQGANVFTRRQTLQELGMASDSIVVVPRIPSLNDGISLVKRVLPDCEFDEQGCVDGIDALDNYSRKWDEHVGDWGEPRHDVYSHGADAFRQFAQAYAIVPEDNLGSGIAAYTPASYGRAGY